VRYYRSTTSEGVLRQPIQKSENFECGLAGGDVAHETGHLFGFVSFVLFVKFFIHTPKQNSTRVLRLRCSSDRPRSDRCCARCCIRQPAKQQNQKISHSACPSLRNSHTDVSKPHDTRVNKPGTMVQKRTPASKANENRKRISMSHSCSRDTENHSNIRSGTRTVRPRVAITTEDRLRYKLLFNNVVTKAKRDIDIRQQQTYKTGIETYRR
jgi:hypothetical protein